MNHRLKHPAFVAGLLENPRRGAEIGVECGHFTEYLMQSFPELEMIAVDPWLASGAFSNWPMVGIEKEFHERMAPYSERLTVIKSRSVDAAGQVENESLDFVFIDAEHTYEAVLDDIAAWQPKVKPGGLLAGHDFSRKYPGVMRAVSEIFPDAGVHTHSAVWWIEC